jgi:hypothetical protein
VRGQVVDRAVSPTIIIVNGSVTGGAAGGSVHRLVGRGLGSVMLSYRHLWSAKHGSVLRVLDRTVGQAAEQAVSYTDSCAVSGATGYTVDGSVLLAIDRDLSFTINRAINRTDRCAVSGATVYALSMVRFYAASRAVPANRAASDTDGCAIRRATGHAVTGFVCCAVNRAVSLFGSRAAGRAVGWAVSVAADAVSYIHVDAVGASTRSGC